MLPCAHIPYSCRGVPYLSGIFGHVLSAHGDRWIVVRNLLMRLYLLVGDCLLQACGIDERILGAVTLRHDGNNGKDVPVGMDIGTLLGLEPDGVVDGLVANDGIRGDVNEAHRLGCSDDRGDILIDGELLHLLIGLLCQRGEGCQSAYG